MASIPTPGDSSGERPAVILLAGPNGAGKSTSKSLVVPLSWPFLNADVVAAQLRDEGHPAAGIDIAAGRFLLAEMRRLVAQRTSFSLETNLAGRGMAPHVASWQQAGYYVWLYFIALRSPELALARVAARVALGGHDIPEDVVRRRWKVGLRAFFAVYMTTADRWSLVDNSDRAALPVARGGGATVEVLDHTAWERLRAAAEDR